MIFRGLHERELLLLTPYRYKTFNRFQRFPIEILVGKSKICFDMNEIMRVIQPSVKLFDFNEYRTKITRFHVISAEDSDFPRKTEKSDRTEKFGLMFSLYIFIIHLGLKHKKTAIFFKENFA